MNLDLKNAYETAIKLAHAHTDITIDLLKSLSALVMKNTGQEYKTALGDFSSAQGDLRLLNVTAGVGGKSYMNYSKVPVKLAEFCNWLNQERKNYASKSVAQLYELSFDTHYHLVTIHPWADGNGRMARLVMNMLQFEFGLIPTKILKDDKEEYIKALVETRENEDLSIFRNFMTATMVKNLAYDIETYRKSIEDIPESGEKLTESRKKKVKSREKIIALLSQDNSLSAAALAGRIGITPKAVEKHIAKMKAEGILKRVGPDKGGHWQILEKN
jgi:Fic family protein